MHHHELVKKNFTSQNVDINLHLNMHMDMHIHFKPLSGVMKQKVFPFCLSISWHERHFHIELSFPSRKVSDPSELYI